MVLLQLDRESLQQAFQHESGMDYVIVEGECHGEQVTAAGVFVVRGNGFAAPVEQHEGIYSLVDVIEGTPFPSNEEIVNVTFPHPVPVVLLTNTSLPPGYLPTIGAHPLLGSLVLQHHTRFMRFTSTPIDGRFGGGRLSQGTYLTSFNDQQFANTGFGAVGRYALPMPVPASYVHDYTIPAGTQLLVGTVSPQFGQAGGGVEVKTVANVDNVVHNSSPRIDDC